ncbi:MAG: c-type cytochrome [Motiliproteus sp.]
MKTFCNLGMLMIRVLGAVVLSLQWGLAWADIDDGVRHEEGREIYNYRCYYCHGYSGDAKTLASSYMVPPPRNFQRAELGGLSRQRMIDVVTQGVTGTGMVSFSRFLNGEEVELVVDFIRKEFMQDKALNTAYHTQENGWPNHRRYQSAFPFATGELAIDSPAQSLTDEQRRGLQLFMTSCISCHDRGRVENEGAIWELRAISYPRNNFSYSNVDGVTSASVYAEHDKPELIGQLSQSERAGEALFQDNCAFCHAADGTGKNWIGSFLDQHPRDLTDGAFMSAVNRDYLRTAIKDGLVGTSMPAWKSVLTEVQVEAIIDYISRAFHRVVDKSESTQ